MSLSLHVPTKKFVVSFAVIISLLGVSFPIVAAQTPANTSTALDDCLAGQKSLSALFLIDESKSLVSTKNASEPPTDPEHQRVPALKAVARTLNSLTKGDGAVRVDVAISGFGERFVVHRDWEMLNNASLDGILSEIDKQADPERSNGLYTRYDDALQGALNKFSSLNQDSAACRLLVWFSDGQHDSDNSATLSNRERNEIQRNLCANDGIADQLRASGVFITAIGLNREPKKLELMRLISENTGRFDGDGFSIENCGQRSATGKFSAAENSTEIVDAINEASPGSPDQDIVVGNCAANADECAEMRFNVDKSVFTFKAQITRPIDSDVKAVLRQPDGTEVSLFEVADSKTEGTVVVERLTPDKAFVVADSSENTSLEGEWTIQFSGSRAKDVTGRVKFVGNASVNIRNEQGTSIEVLDRYNPEKLFIEVDSGSVNNVVEGARVFLRTGDQEVEMVSGAEEAGVFSIESQEISKALTAEQLKDASAVTLQVVPNGYINGLQGPNGERIEVEYRPTATSQKLLSVSNGAQLPRYLADKTSLEDISIKDTQSVKLRVWFTGPDAVDGVVRFVSIDESDNEFELVSEPPVCQVSRQEENFCEVTVQPKKDGYGEAVIPLRAVLSSGGSSDTTEQVIPVAVKLTRGVNVSKGIQQALLLLLLFIVVQAAIRLFFAYLLSRFSALNATARRVRVPVFVDQNGTITGENGAQLRITENVVSFAHEASEGSIAFTSDEYEFAASPIRTFFKSTTTPQGYVTRDGHWIYGSLGVIQPKKDLHSDVSRGVVSLHLRGEWILSFAFSEVQSFALGSEKIEAELFAFFDDPSLKSFDTQLEDVFFEVNSSGFVDALRDAGKKVLSTPSADDRNEINDVSSISPADSEVFTNDDPFGSASNSLTYFSDSPTERSTKKRRGRRQKNDESETGNGHQQSASFETSLDSYDPFS